MKGKKPAPGSTTVELEYQQSIEDEKEGKKKKDKSVTKSHSVKVHPKLIELIGMDGAKFNIDA